MRSGKSRHKLLAVEFLSNISLDGTRHSAEVKFAETKANGTECLFHSTKQNHTSASCALQALRSDSQPDHCPSCAHSDSSFRASEYEHVQVQQIPQFSPIRPERSSELSNSCTPQQSSYNHALPVSKHAGSPLPPISPAFVDHSAITGRHILDADAGGDEKPPVKWVVGLSRWLLGKRLNLCLPRCSEFPMAVFTINPTKRTVSDSTFRCVNRTSRSVVGGKTATGEMEVGSLASSSPYGIVLLGADDVDPISSRRPTGDTVHSCASVLHTFRSKQMPIRIYIPHSTPRPDSNSDPNIISLIQSFSSCRTTDAGGQLFTINQESHKTSFSNAHRSNLVASQLRSPTTSTTVLTTASSPVGGITVPRTYIDPLVCYSPNLLDDPDLLVVTGKRVFPLPNYLTSVLTYVRPTEQKRNVNREFHGRFPMIQLTLTKLRSIKSVLVQLVAKLSFDLWIAAHAHVLFEKLVLKLFVNKTNRRACASASLLISAKLNDIKGQDLDSLFQELENVFRISRHDILSVEVDMCLGLEFCLIPSEFEISPHFIRIHRALDIPPPYLMSYMAHPVL